VILFFGALEAWLSGEWDRAPRSSGAYTRVELAERIQELDSSAPSQLMAAARRSGRCRVLACSASLSLIGRRDEELGERVDEVVGWPTIVHLMQPGTQVLYL
jgi:predicted peroxiredoxin